MSTFEEQHSPSLSGHYNAKLQVKSGHCLSNLTSVCLLLVVLVSPFSTNPNWSRQVAFHPELGSGGFLRQREFPLHLVLARGGFVGFSI